MRIVLWSILPRLITREIDAINKMIMFYSCVDKWISTLSSFRMSRSFLSITFLSYLQLSEAGLRAEAWVISTAVMGPFTNNIQGA